MARLEIIQYLGTVVTLKCPPWEVNSFLGAQGLTGAEHVGDTRGELD